VKRIPAIRSPPIDRPRRPAIPPRLLSRVSFLKPACHIGSNRRWYLGRVLRPAHTRPPSRTPHAYRGGIRESEPPQGVTHVPGRFVAYLPDRLPLRAERRHNGGDNGTCGASAEEGSDKLEPIDFWHPSSAHGLDLCRGLPANAMPLSCGGPTKLSALQSRPSPAVSSSGWFGIPERRISRMPRLIGVRPSLLSVATQLGPLGPTSLIQDAPNVRSERGAA